MKVIVKSYKPSGKWYHTEETQIELRTIDDVLDLEEKIKCNDESIQHLSGLKQGFSQYFTYMIELKSDNLFMDFIIHSNEFIRSSEVFSEKEKNTTQRQKNEKLEQVLADVNNIMDTIVNGHHFTDDIEGHLKELAKMAMQKINEVRK